MILVEEHNLSSIVFPAISTGFFGFPINKCAEIMLQVIIEYLKRPTILKKVAICLWNDENFKIFKKQLTAMIS